MIFVDRSAVNPPEVLVRSDSKGRREFDRWRDYYEKVDGGEEAEEPKGGFKAYKEPEVRDALEALFAGKCGYCESRVKVISYGDIEHWRPKKSVLLADGTRTNRGYWWHAADWDNLLLSCALCNRQGKGIQFPVDDEAHRARSPGEDAFEKPLLLNPTEDRPERHLTVVLEGEGRAVLQAVAEDAKGLRSLEVLRLNREELRNRRRQRLSDVFTRVHAVRVYVKMLDRLPAGFDTSDIDRDLEQKLEELADMLQPGQEFLMLTRRIVEPFLREIGAS